MYRLRSVLSTRRKQSHLPNDVNKQCLSIPGKPLKNHLVMSILEIILAIFLPPVAVFLRKGVGVDLVINILLWVFLIGIGGIIHAFWILSKK